MSQLTFLSLAGSKKALRCEKFLNEMKKVIPWKSICSMIAPHYSKGIFGRKPMPLLLMLQIHCLQQWYQLSDPAMEEAIYDRNSFQKFLSLDLLKDRVPDETTILNFRHLLEKHALMEKIFVMIKSYLAQKGLLMKEGTIVDATLISSPSSTKNCEKKRDPEMSSTKKNNKWYFGMKAHIGVDAKSGIIHSCDFTTAKIHDKKCLPSLLHGEEESVFGDKGYTSDEDKNKAREAEIYWGILDKAKPFHPLSSKQKKRNKKLSSIRSKVEHPFQVIKCLWGYRKTRYRGIQKNANQLMMLFALTNLFKMRKKLLLA